MNNKNDIINGLISKDNKRSETRIIKSLLAYTNTNTPELLGVISNISKSGFLMESKKTFVPGTPIDFLMSIYSEVYQVSCEVRWIKQSQSDTPGFIPCKMGARITHAPIEYLNFIEYQKRGIGVH